MSCFACHISFSNLNTLFNHLKAVHLLNGNSDFLCYYPGCFRTIPTWKGYKRHLGSHESSTSSEIPPEELINFDECLEGVEGAITIECCTPSISDYKDAFAVIESVPEPQNSEHTHAFNQTDEPSVFPKGASEKLFSNSLLFISKMFANPDLTRQHVQECVDDVSTLISTNISVLSDVISDHLVSAGVAANIVENVVQLTQQLTSPFSGLTSEYLQFKALRERGFYIDPVTFVCGRTNVSGVSKSVKAQFIPLRKVLKSFFELPNVLSSVKEHVKYLHSLSDHGVLKNFIQGELWKAKQAEFHDKFVLPLFLFFDDIEIGNVLGSHSGVYKLGAVYVWCPCLPPEFMSSLENYFLTMLFHSDDRKADNPYFESSNNHIVFAKVIEELNFLRSQGISVVTEQGTFQVYFDLGLIIGDNLGLNSILGFVESFSAHFFCRMCKVSKAESCSCTEEKIELLRTVESYNADVEVRNCTLTGIKEKCVWNNVEGFHVAKAGSLDWMHDVLEGTAKYDLVNILPDLIGKNYFSLEQLNFRIINFKYGDTVSNKPLPISESELADGSIRMSANEMLNFIICLAPMIGSLVPEDDDSWKLFLLLRDIVDILCCTSIQINLIDELHSLIVQHHSLYVKLFGCTLKPKHHLMLHYCRVIRQSGPLIHLWCMRFESRHRLLKRIANVISSRVDTPMSISIKTQLNLAHRFLSQKGFEERISLSSNSCVIQVSTLPFFSLVQHILPASFHGLCKTSSHISLNGTKYKQNSCIVVGVNELGSPNFGIVKSILVNSSSEVCFVYNKLITVFRSYQHSCYFVDETENVSCISYKMLPCPFPRIFSKLENEQTIVVCSKGA